MSVKKKKPKGQKSEIRLSSCLYHFALQSTSGLEYFFGISDELVYRRGYIIKCLMDLHISLEAEYTFSRKSLES
jgi:hypothetical protein